MVENENMLPILLSKIIKIEDKENNEIKFNKIDYVIKKRKHSTNESVVIYIDNQELKCGYFRSLYVTYKCRCGRNVKMLFMKYIKKSHYWCQHCCQDTSFKEHYRANDIIKGKKTQEKRIIPDFESISTKEQENYWKNHLRKDEFNYWLPYLVKINNKEILDKTQIKYLDVVKNYNNQKRYTSKVSFDDGNKYEGFNSVSLKCSCCGKVYNKHIFNLRTENINNPECGFCKLCNHQYKIRKYKDTCLTYQSKTEEYFLNKCFENNIKVMNGYEIPYEFNGKERTYISDFYLPDYKILLEIKGRNKFYRNDLASGKLTAKNNAASKFCNENNLIYQFVFGEDIDNFILALLNERDSQSIGNAIGIG